VPRSTLLDWEKRDAELQADSPMAEQFESPQGLLSLHRIVLAARLTFVIEKHIGERGQQLFLQRAGIARFVACSKGSLGQANTQMLEAIATFGLQQQMRLQSEVKEPVDVMVQPDEVFRQGPILVALEGHSGFILVQQRSERRDAVSWIGAWCSATETLPIRLIGGTGDEAGALRCTWETGLGVSYFSDVFHVQHEITSGCCANLARQVRHAKKALDKVLEAEKAHPQVFEQGKTAAVTASEPLAPAAISPKRQDAQEKLKQAEQRRGEMKQAIVGLGEALHPFNLNSCEAKTAEQVEVEMTAHFTRARDVVARAKLGDKATDALDKAQKLVASMASQVTFWHSYCERWVGQQGLEPRVQTWLLMVLLPVLYLTAAAGRVPGADKRRELRARSAQRMAELMTGESVWRDLSRMQQVLLLQGLERCVGLWQRASSGVEGYNGQVSRHDRALHSLPPKWMEALQVIHNYATLRGDGTTAMERLFGLKPPDMFEWLVDHLPLPPRPSCPRKRLPAANPLLLD
jgi:hypothetical protein